MKLHFFGAAGMVTGSCYLITDEDSHGILIDMGMFQGSADIEALNMGPLLFDARNVHSVFVTHAHLDHVGRLPLLIKNNFSGKLYMTAPTKEIAKVVLLDAAKIMRKDEEKSVLYTEGDVFNLMEKVQIVSYGEPVDLESTVSTFRDAGHILGSGSLEIKSKKNGKIHAFSGDLGNSPEDIVRPTELIKKANTVILESTYGDREHPKDDPKKALQKEINAVEESGGALLVPSFSVERVQALLYKIAHLKKDGRVKAETPVYLDSPMGERVTKIYRDFPELYSKELSEDFKTGDPFSFDNLHILKNHRESLGLKNIPGPKVIIAGSGMINGGRILEHAMHYLPIATTRLLIVGFQAENTLGREIEEGAKEILIYGQKVGIKAEVITIHSMSAHADQPKLLGWLKAIEGVNDVFLIHGEDGPRTALLAKIKNTGISNIYMPKIGDSYSV